MKPYLKSQSSGAIVRAHPVGMDDNSPGFQPWVSVGRTTSPEGTAESLAPQPYLRNNTGANAYSPRGFCFAATAAFSLIEILVTVALMSAIILGLLLMFNQVQRAFRGSLVAKDVMEAGRNIMDMIGREIEQMTPSESPNTVNFFQRTSDWGMQGLPGMKNLRTNVAQQFFFMSKMNQDWYGTGYLVAPENQRVGAGVGTLYRYSTNYTLYPATNWYQAFLNTPYTNFSRIAEGVVHFRVTPYDFNGVAITQFKPATIRNTYRRWDNGAMQSQMITYFTNNAVPAYVEVELGILESQVLERWRSIGVINSGAQDTYLSNHVAEVHLFRQRFPVRNVDFAAYQ